MSKREKCKFCGKLIEYHDYTYDALNERQSLVCDPDDVRRHASNLKRNAKARERRAIIAEVMDNVGMVRVRGNLGGTYYE